MADALTRYSPSGSYPITRLSDVVSRLFDESFVMPSIFDRSFGQAMRGNLFETPNDYIVQLALPGMDPQKFEVEMTGQYLRVSGTYNLPTPEGATLIWNGLSGGTVVETLSLPGEVDATKAEAGYQDGILTITLPKSEHSKPKTITVKSH